jgi:hypothetical protein
MRYLLVTHTSPNGRATHLHVLGEAAPLSSSLESFWHACMYTWNKVQVFDHVFQGSAQRTLRQRKAHASGAARLKLTKTWRRPEQKGSRRSLLEGGSTRAWRSKRRSGQGPPGVRMSRRTWKTSPMSLTSSLQTLKTRWPSLHHHFTQQWGRSRSLPLGKQWQARRVDWHRSNRTVATWMA